MSKNKTKKCPLRAWILYLVVTLILMALSYFAGYLNTSSKDYIRGRSDGLEEACKQEKQFKLHEDSEKPFNSVPDKPAASFENQSEESEEDDK